MQRTVVYRLEGNRQTNVNDEIGLDPFLSYTLAEHLEDLASEGMMLAGVNDAVHLFKDHTIQVLVQRRERIETGRLDEDTMLQVLSSLAMRGPGSYAGRELAFAC